MSEPGQQRVLLTGGTGFVGGNVAAVIWGAAMVGAFVAGLFAPGRMGTPVPDPALEASDRR